MEQLVNQDFTKQQYDMPIFCEKHRVQGCLAFRDGGQESLIYKSKKIKKPLTKEQKLAIDQKIQKRK